MLGEMVGKESGQVTLQRVLPTKGQGLLVEVSFLCTGMLSGVAVTDVGTFEAAARPDGNLQGEGQGVVTTEDGEVATWLGGGVGKFTGPGAVKWRGAIYYQTASPKLASLNDVAAIYEFDVDANGNIQHSVWEWK